MPRTHTVRQGECLSSIARRYGFVDYRKIYDHPSNAAYRARRPDPNVIFPGDEVVVPDHAPHEEDCATGRLHAFTLRRPRRVLRLAIEDLAGERVRNAPYTLVVDGRAYAGTTSGQGLVEQQVAADAEHATLEVNGHRWPLRIGHLNPLDDAPDEGVSGIQARLRNLGYDPGPVDGRLGPRTAAAIRAFQRDTPGLAVDGVCGPRTRARLVARHGS